MLPYRSDKCSSQLLEWNRFDVYVKVNIFEDVRRPFWTIGRICDSLQLCDRVRRNTGKRQVFRVPPVLTGSRFMDIRDQIMHKNNWMCRLGYLSEKTILHRTEG
ncbi:hypothetical protein CN878_00375 [Ochrobactrum sp. 695/2009]|nr:hypothetical protein CN880_09425 [Ochrobactrum sp. 720/2009]PJT26378.1 hypothetical protein CN879_05390 [Ochrobactrum sp. 715/2009]PJT31690.1 hypothetical protein CN878_00375 [Ochrobactrum sp. 695/2009]PJT35897.1 hypothetical protein CN877_07835 [Ochrobactrum sp. 689/2009]